jgi:hypothetical protein
MRLRNTLVLAAILGVANVAMAQPAEEPPLLKLPMGARVRVQTTAAPGNWVKGILVSADAASVALVPEDAPPLGANQLRLPNPSIGRFELKTGSKRHWLAGLIVGAALGLAMGATADVNPDTCNYTYSYEFCSRGEAIAASVAVLGGMGAGIGALVKTDRWTAVALDALPPPPPRVSGTTAHFRSRPGGGVELGLTVGF